MCGLGEAQRARIRRVAACSPSLDACAACRCRDPSRRAIGRDWLLYRCDLITQRIVDTRAVERGARRSWCPVNGHGAAVGAAVARLHRAGVDHADLNAHNMLLGAERRGRA